MNRGGELLFGVTAVATGVLFGSTLLHGVSAGADYIKERGERQRINDDRTIVASRYAGCQIVGNVVTAAKPTRESGDSVLRTQVDLKLAPNQSVETQKVIDKYWDNNKVQWSTEMRAYLLAKDSEGTYVRSTEVRGVRDVEDPGPGDAPMSVRLQPQDTYPEGTAIAVTLISTTYDTKRAEVNDTQRQCGVLKLVETADGAQWQPVTKPISFQ